MCREIGVSAVSLSCLGLISPRGIGFWVVFFSSRVVRFFYSPMFVFCFRLKLCQIIKSSSASTTAGVRH